MAIWLDGIVDEKTWRGQERRLLIVCPSPNEDWMVYTGDDRRDMRELLRRPESSRKTFYTHLRQAVRAFHNLPSRSDRGEEQDQGDLVRRIAFIDLKNSGGGARADKSEIMEATKTRQTELKAQILSIEPSHIAVAGAVAQGAFDRHIRKHIQLGIRVCNIRHPSWRYGNADMYYRCVQDQMASEFPHVRRQPVGCDPKTPGPAGATQQPIMGSDKPGEGAFPANKQTGGTPDHTLSPAQLADMRWKLIRLLDQVDDAQDRPQGEGIAARIGRLTWKGLITRQVAACMRTITEFRNVAEYEAKTPSPAETKAVEAAWAVVKEWAASLGLKLPDRE